MQAISPIQEQYLKAFARVKPYLDDMRNSWKLYPDYKGWADIDSPIFLNPDILFVGINRGDGRFRSWNWNKDEKDFSLPPDYPTPWRSQLQYTKNGTARIDEWWDNSPQRNLFPHTMCELLVRVYRHFSDYKYPFPRKDLTPVFESRVMATNVYPMVTSKDAQLRRLMQAYQKNTGVNIKQLCKYRLRSIIELTEPKVVVLLGKSVERDISYIFNDFHQPYYCLSRQVGWHGKKNISKAADAIFSLMTHV